MEALYLTTVETMQSSRWISLSNSIRSPLRIPRIAWRCMKTWRPRVGIQSRWVTSHRVFCLLLSSQAWLISYHLGVIAQLLPKLWKVRVNSICISPDHKQWTNKQSTVRFSLSRPTSPEKYSWRHPYLTISHHREDSSFWKMGRIGCRFSRHSNSGLGFGQG